MYSVLNRFSEYKYFYITKNIHTVFGLLSKSSKAFSVSSQERFQIVQNRNLTGNLHLPLIISIPILELKEDSVIVFFRIAPVIYG